jgi:hypothetical protein
MLLSVCLLSTYSHFSFTIIDDKYEIDWFDFFLQLTLKLTQRRKSIYFLHIEHRFWILSNWRYDRCKALCSSMSFLACKVSNICCWSVRAAINFDLWDVRIELWDEICCFRLNLFLNEAGRHEDTDGWTRHEHRERSLGVAFIVVNRWTLIGTNGVGSSSSSSNVTSRPFDDITSPITRTCCRRRSSISYRSCCVRFVFVSTKRKISKLPLEATMVSPVKINMIQNNMYSQSMLS